MKCLNCTEEERCRDSFTSWIFFLIGLIATIAVRIVIVLFEINPAYAKTAWYIGVSGFFLFFIYKFRVNQARHKLIEQRKLVDRILQKDQLAEEDYKLISAILCSFSSKKERINYFFIFALSAAALAVAIYFDFIR